MTVDAMTDLEWSRIERGLEKAECQGRDTVTISVRALRALFDEATGANWAGQLSDAEDDAERAEDRASELEAEVSRLKTQMALTETPIGGVK